MAYTVMGDAVNVASRLEGLTKEYGVEHILVSETTKNAVPDFIFRYIDCVRVKGKDESVKIFTPLGMKQDISSEVLNELELYEETIKHYLNKEWETAEKQFLNLQKVYGERKLYKLFLTRLKYFHSNPPPPDWDGVFTFTSK